MTPKEGKTQCVKNKACFALGNRELKRERIVTHFLLVSRERGREGWCLCEVCSWRFSRRSERARV